VNATLWDRGGGLIYDDVLDVTWLQNANYAATELTTTRINEIIAEVGSIDGYTLDEYDFGTNAPLPKGRMSWYGAIAWTQCLEYYDTVRNVTWKDWRLPRTLPVNGSVYTNLEYAHDGSTDRGYNISAPGSAYPGSTASEMAYMYYNNLVNLGYIDVNGNSPQPGWGLIGTSFVDGSGNIVSFENLQDFIYFSGTESPSDPGHSFYFRFNTGEQGNPLSFGGKVIASNFAWAVRDGDVGPIDSDSDGIPNNEDNCPLYENPPQEDNDGDEEGDACDPDDDNDGILDEDDNCPMVNNQNQEDSDNDGIGDTCDDLTGDFIVTSIVPSYSGDQPVSSDVTVESTFNLNVTDVGINLIASVCGEENVIDSKTIDLFVGSNVIPFSPINLGSIYTDQPIILYAIIDPVNEFAEQDEANNEVGTIIKVGTVSSDQLEIITSTSASSEYCPDKVATFRGISSYKLLNEQTACFDLPVKRGSVAYELFDVTNGNQIIDQGNVKTGTNGIWAIHISMPDKPNTEYFLQISVTDDTLFDETKNISFTLKDDCNSQSPPPSPPKIIPGPNPEPPPPLFDAWVNAVDIQFSKEHPDIGETIIVNGIVHVPVDQSYSGIPITWRATVIKRIIYF